MVDTFASTPSSHMLTVETVFGVPAPQEHLETDIVLLEQRKESPTHTTQRKTELPDPADAEYTDNSLSDSLSGELSESKEDTASVRFGESSQLKGNNVMAEVLGLSSSYPTNGQASEAKRNQPGGYMDYTKVALERTDSWESVTESNLRVTNATTTLLDVEGKMIKSQTRVSSFETSVDMMRRTMRRYSEQNHTRPALDLSNSEEKGTASKNTKKDNSKAKAKEARTSSKDRDTKSPRRPDSVESPGMMDKLMDRLVMSALSTASLDPSKTDWRAQNLKGKPPFSINTMSRNFRQMTARTGIAFDAIYTIQDILSWKSPSLTLSVFAIYTYLVLYPGLIPALPFLFLAFHVMTPAYMYRHPADRTFIRPANPIPARGPPLTGAVIPKPVPELSREFFYNVVDTQNFMVGYTELYDMVLDSLKRFAFFDSDERTSSFMFLGLILAAYFVYYVIPLVVHYTPWRVVFLVGGWVVAGVSHPRYREHLVEPLKLEMKARKESGQKTLKKVVSSTHRRVSGLRSDDFVIEDVIDQYEEMSDDDDDDDQFSQEGVVSGLVGGAIQEPDAAEEHYDKIWQLIDDFAHREFDCEDVFEERQVEIFEVQCIFRTIAKQTCTHCHTETSVFVNEEGVGHWGASLFTNHPYLPVMRGSAVPSNASPGSAALSQVQAPAEWQYVPAATWKLDMEAEKWVSRRGVPVAAQTGDSFVTVDDEEKWIYDKHPVAINQNNKDEPVRSPTSTLSQKDKPRMYIRRRRWTRVCRRVAVKTPSN